MNSFTVVLDACVLYPAPLRDLLVQMACLGMYRAKWSDRIHNEWIESLLENEPTRRRERLERCRELMNQAVVDSLVIGYDDLIDSVELPDPDDRHVLAAAICSSADAIVTFNLADFPDNELEKYSLEAVHPDDFLCSQLSLDIIKGCTAAKHCRERLTQPAYSVDEYLANLRRQNLPNAVRRLEQCQDLL